MPKLGNTVESAIIVRWHKQIGDEVRVGDVLCEVETDKATMAVESTGEGTLLAQYYAEGDEVPVLVDLALLGEPDEDISAFSSPAVSTSAHTPVPMETSSAPNAQPMERERLQVYASPRARQLAKQREIDWRTLRGTGPHGRIIERDVRAALNDRVRVTPVAQAMLNAGDYILPERSERGRIGKKDLIPVTQPHADAAAPRPVNDGVTILPLKGPRKVIAARMLESMQTTAQLTLNTSADARVLLDYRRRLKQSPVELGLPSVTINDLILFCVSRTLVQFRDLNSLLIDNAIHRYAAVHLGVAVDTDRGLMVPVIREAQRLTLKALSDEAHRLASACVSGQITPDELTGGTFTVTNLGSLGIESFTPILNPPQVAILGVGSIFLKPVDVDGEVAFIPHLGLSLTVNHQVVDGAPAARFLQALVRNLSHFELLLSL